MSLINSLSKLLAPPVFEGDEEKTRVASLLNTVLLFLFATPFLLIINAIFIPANRPLALPVTAFMFVVLIAMSYFVRRGYVQAMSAVALGFLFVVVGYLSYLNGGEARPLNVFYTLIIVMGGLLLGGWGALAATLISAVEIGVFIYAGSAGLITVRLQAPPPPVAWITYVGGFALIGVVLRLASTSLNSALVRARRNEGELQVLTSSLEQRVTDRTRELALAAEIGRTISQVRDQSTLLDEAVELIQKLFNLYYAQIYLTDAAGNALVMTAGTGPVGAELKLRNFRLPIGPGSLNGTAAATRSDVLVADTTQSNIFRPNPLLPDTRSELTVPLLVGQQVVGVLDLQSSQPNTFNEENKQAFDILAAQLAIAIQNNALFAQAQTARAELEAQARNQTRTGWSEFLDAVHNTEVMQSTYQGQNSGPENQNTVSQVHSTPIKIVGESVGQLRVEAGRALSESETQLVGTVAEQVARQIENVRLLSQAEQYRAEAEQAARRRTGEDWAAYGRNQASQEAYEYDGNEVVRVNAQTPNQKQGYTQTITVHGEAIGEIIMSTSNLDAQATELLDVITTQLGTHIENLRLSDGLTQRAAELQTVAQVSATASNTLEADKLVQSVVDLTKNAFGLYHAHLYLLDETGDNLVLAAGAGEAGRIMLAQGWSIPFNREHSLVARAARTGKGVIENDVRGVRDFMPNPLLPETRSELAVPMIVGSNVLGVFDVQAASANYFTEDDVLIQTTLAAQVAIALQNARLYAEQAETTEHLRDVDKLKSAFLANMSHELRTPLNSIIGFTDVILEGLDGPLTTRQTHDLQLVHKNGLHLLNLITDVLDMAKIEAGKLNLSLEPFNLQDILKEVVETTAPMARNKELNVKLQGFDARLDLEADRLRVRQVVLNLVNNAIKFTDNGGTISIKGARSNGHVVVSVHDTGIGIPAGHIENIFKEFHQVDTSTTRKTGGTGLGLPISRHLIELHGGRLWAESEGVAGQGSTFIFEVPVESHSQN
jgi:signal transduction histidine kinase